MLRIRSDVSHGQVERPWKTMERFSFASHVNGKFFIGVMVFSCSVFICNGFTSCCIRHFSHRSHLFDTPESDDPDGSGVWDLKASGSFGSLLMQMQKKEEALLAAGTDVLAEPQVVDLDPSKVQNDKKKPKQPIESTSALPTMDWETAKELDGAVSVLVGSRSSFTESIQKLPRSPLFDALESARFGVEAVPLGEPEQLMHRDRRHLAVSIAASCESVEDWQMFCREGGGLVPVLETIREGANALQIEKDSSSETDVATKAWLDTHKEEAFQAACNACRAIRDICAISPELAAVITDGILRANASWKGGLMKDFCAILKYASDSGELYSPGTKSARELFRLDRKSRREARVRGKLFVTQLLLALAVASDDAIHAIRSTKGLLEPILACSSYAPKERRRRWLRYPREVVKWIWKRQIDRKVDKLRRPFLEAANLANDLNGEVQRTANQILAAVGHNTWNPKIPGQRGLRILSLDGGGSRGMAAVAALNYVMEAAGDGADVADSFDIIAGTSTGGIISFLVGLRRESSANAVKRYNQLIKQIFVKSALSTPLMLFTTATYDESPFMGILSSILKDSTMLDSRADPAVPLVFCVTSKMSSTPTHVALFRNYNYFGGELPDPFTIDADRAREDLNLLLEKEHPIIRSGLYARKKAAASSPGTKIADGSRHPGSFRLLQRYALRASTAAPTVFKPVMMGGEMYCDGGIVASNPTAVAIHEARTLFPNIPIELVVSIGTGAFLEQKSAPRIGWDGIIGQIVNSATDGEQIHHILEDILGDSSVLGRKGSAFSGTRYFRFNPVVGMPDEFPIDVTDPDKLRRLKQITRDYLDEPEQRERLAQIKDILRGRKRLRTRVKEALRFTI